MSSRPRADSLNARSAGNAPLLPWGSATGRRRSDAVLAAIVGAYLVAYALGAGRWPFGEAIDSVLYAIISVATIWQTARVTRLALPGTNRIAWALLTLAHLLRFTSGLAWDRWNGSAPGGGDPLWLVIFSLSFLGVAVPALLVFPSGNWRARDALRARIDAATILIGALLMVWFLAIGPLLRSPALATAPLDDRIYVLGDSLMVLLAGGLFLRAATIDVRLAAGWLLAAYTLRLAPDLVLWQGGAPPDFSAFAPIGTVWTIAWVLQWAAARAAESERDAGGGTPAVRRRYESGAVPHLFLGAAVSVLLYQLAFGGGQDGFLFALGSAALTLLLVARQSVELDERDRLANRLDWEGERFRALLQHAYDAVALIGSDGNVRYASPATIQLVGDALHATAPGSLISLVHPDDRAQLEAALADVERPVHALRLRVRDRQGAWRTFDGQLHDHRRDPLIDGIVLHGIDRTREHRLAEGLELTQPLEALGVLAGGLAHDLNNILTVVASHGELLAEDRTLDARARADVDAIRAASDRARALTSGLLTLSRRKEEVPALLQVPDAIRSRSPGGEAIPIDVVPGAALQVRVDPAAMSQIVDALIEVASQEAHGAAVRVMVSERVIDDVAAGALRVEPRLYVAISVGTGDGLGVAEAIEEAVRTETGEEWDLAPGDLALLIGLAACREIGGTVVRERRSGSARLVALLPAVHQ